MEILLMAGGVLLGILAWIDIRTKKVSLLVLGVFAAVMCGIRMVSIEPDVKVAAEIAVLAAGLLPGAVSLLFSFVTKGKLGIGDGLVLLVIGLGLGFRRTMFLWIAAFCMAAVFAVVLLALKKAGRNTELPFVPYLFLGYVLCQVTGL